jgi:hypothetical protein
MSFEYHQVKKPAYLQSGFACSASVADAIDFFSKPRNFCKGYPELFVRPDVFLDCLKLLLEWLFPGDVEY